MKKSGFKIIISYVMFLSVLSVGYAETQALTLPLDQRPEWVRQEGIVMAGDWEPLLYRVRRDSPDGSYTPTPEQIAAYNYEHSPEMIARLKAIGVNFVMTHCYKGAGMIAEGQSMKDAAAFAKLCRENNIRVGVYNYSGALIWERFKDERPDAIDWLSLDSEGSFIHYGNQKFRCNWNRSHPEARAYYRKIVNFAVNEIQADLLHFDNYERGGPKFDRNSVLRFREYLFNTFTPDELKAMGIDDVDTVMPPKNEEICDMLTKVWANFVAQSLADDYYDMGRYARSLRKDILLEGNFLGVPAHPHPMIDHGRLLAGGEAYWDENGPPGYKDGKLNTRIRNYKVGRLMKNMNFNYMTTKLSMAESMAFNLDCLGCIAWFEYGKLKNFPGQDNAFDPNVLPYIQFFHQRRDILSYADVVADIAVLRSYPSESFADPQYEDMTTAVEDLMIEKRQCFQIIYDRHLKDLSRYKVLVLAGCAAMSDEQIQQVKDYIDNGGKAVVVSDLAILDKWGRPRDTSPLAHLPSSQVVYIENVSDVLDSVNTLCPNELSLNIKCEYPVAEQSEQGKKVSDSTGLCVELTAKKDKRFLHLVNYRHDQAAENVAAEVKIPKGKKCSAVKLASPDHENDITLPFHQKDNRVSFTVPKVQIYEIAQVSYN